MSSWAKRLGVAGSLIGLLAGGGWLGVDLTLSTLAGGALASRGMHCEPLDVGFALDGSRADLGPTTCTFERGNVDELRLTGGGHADLDSERRVTRVEVSGLELDLNEDPPRDMISGLVQAGQVPDRLQASMRSLAELAARDDVPDLAVRRILLRRGTRFVTFRRVSIEHDGDGLTVRVAEAAPPPMGSERLRIAGRMVDLEVRASPAAVSVSGRMEIEATLGRREIEEAVPFSLRGAGLDTEAASFTAEVELTENLRRLRERHERRVAEQAAAAAAPPEAPLDERIHGLRESLQETLDSMRDGS